MKKFDIFSPPMKGIYSRREKKYINGIPQLVTFRYNVEIFRKTSNSFFIMLPNGRETWVNRKNVLLGYESGGYCTKRNRELFRGACKACFEKCAYSLTDFPNSSY